MKIGLLTPYGGTNLGDAAIQEAVIHNIRKRQPDADVRLVTLQPEKTSQLHGVSSFPITSLAIAYYSQGRSHKKFHINETDPLAAGTIAEKHGFLARIKAYIKRYPLLFSTLNGVYRLLLRIVRVPALLHGEISHFIEACRFMKRTDILLVSGGGQLDDYWGGPWGHPYSLFKWGLIARTVGARYVFLGVGTGSFKSRLSKLFIRLALKLAVYRSYRDLVSKKLLEAMTFTHDDPVCPDLAYSLARTGLAAPNRSNANLEKTVGVNLIAHLRHNMPKKDPYVYECYLTNLVLLLKGLFQRGYTVILFLTDSPDRHVIKEVGDILAKDSTLDASGRIRHVRTETLDELFAGLESMDYVLASRLHAVLLSHLAKKPVLAISYDRKVETYMCDVGFSEYCFDINRLNIDSLLMTFDAMVADANGIESRLQEIDAVYTRLLDRQYDLVLEH